MFLALAESILPIRFLEKYGRSRRRESVGQFRRHQLPCRLVHAFQAVQCPRRMARVPRQIYDLFPDCDARQCLCRCSRRTAIVEWLGVLQGKRVCRQHNVLHLCNSRRGSYVERHFHGFALQLRGVLRLACQSGIWKAGQGGALGNTCSWVGSGVSGDHKYHTATCPVGTYQRGWRAYASTYLDDQVALLCCQ